MTYDIIICFFFQLIRWFQRRISKIW